MSVAWLALNSVNGLGPVRFARLLEKYGSPEAVLDVPRDLLTADGILSDALVEKLRDPGIVEAAEQQLDKASRTGISVLTLADERYPPYLRQIFAPPPVIFVKGDLSAVSRHAVGIVGTRSPTVYGKQATTLITRELVNEHFVIVSGLARGIDTVAHETALASGGATIAVLGCGIDIIYPRVNEPLARKIASGTGLIVSEFPLGTLPETFNFPRRNRIISGLSAAVVVVEAGEKSGALITARYALQQGREVCAVPGPINSPLSRGTFNLIKEGATPVRSGRELAESLAAVTAPLGAAEAAQEPAELPETVFSEEERQIYNGLSDRPARIDEIAEQHRMPIADLFVMLLNLELKGLVQQCSGQQFVKVATTR